MHNRIADLNMQYIRRFEFGHSFTGSRIAESWLLLILKIPPEPNNPSSHHEQYGILTSCTSLWHNAWKGHNITFYDILVKNAYHQSIHEKTSDQAKLSWVTFYVILNQQLPKMLKVRKCERCSQIREAHQ